VQLGNGVDGCARRVFFVQTIFILPAKRWALCLFCANHFHFACKKMGVVTSDGLTKKNVSDSGWICCPPDARGNSHRRLPLAPEHANVVDLRRCGGAGGRRCPLTTSRPITIFLRANMSAAYVSGGHRVVCEGIDSGHSQQQQIFAL
jgi:hypothetical protein